MTSIVALDLETTGLDPHKDAITEIGAVRFNDNRIEDEFTTLINPQRPIPAFITKLTGITNAMVRNAPTFEEILPDLVEFVGDSPVLGHNVKFDLGFLRARGICKYNEALDTYDMASVLMPDAGRYNLSALGQQLDILLPATHRAMDDAKVTHAVYQRLFQKALELPLDILAEIIRLGDYSHWGAEYLFKQALKHRSKEVVPPKEGHTYSGPLFTTPPPGEIVPRLSEGEFSPLDIEEVVAILERGGEFSRHFEHFEHRPEQVELCRNIATALSESRHLLAEAGTGTGKSLAYLIPSALWALKNDTRVVISTNTINLQDQLINKDIPDVSAVIGNGLKTSVMKGRNNYLCPRRLEAIRRKGPESEEELRVIAKMLIWLNGTGNGDLSQVNITGPAERAVWSRISANDDGCTTETCVRRMGGICPFHRAKQAAHEAHILVVNHALLLADVATGSRVLPDYEYLIVDEAHHIEDATTSALSFRVTQGDVERTLKELGGSNAGMLGRTLAAAKDLLDPGQLAALHKMIDTATDKAFQFQNSFRQFFITIDNFLEEERDGRKLGSYSHKERIIPATRTQPAWVEVELAWEETGLALNPLMDYIEQVSKALSELAEAGEDEIEDLVNNINNIYRRLSEYDNNLTGLVFEPSQDTIYWAEINPQYQKITLEAAPLHIGGLMEKHLWHEKTSVSLTSATMTTNGDFDYIRSRLNAQDAEEISLGSPFYYESSTLLYIPDNIPEPSDHNGHQRAVERGLIDLCSATGGRALALFTSYAQLQATSRAISPALAEHGIVVYEQGQGASAHSLLESFKSSPQAVLLGTRAFWEGVDIPGEDLSVLAIIKIPFAVPSDPIVAARSETFEQPFYEYSIPEAILTFRQGFGRLIRSKNDRGVVAIFDRRVLTKQYGHMFIDSLPTCTVKVGNLSELPKAAVDWLGI
ncbi:MAG: exonuclease domain-containing protein [Anaerolineae bacterium]|nr:exonuclease domain-containing protein [Anaerolineae bacterium]